MATDVPKHAGPSPGFLALVYTALFGLGLLYVVWFSADALLFPGPWIPGETLTAYFEAHAHALQRCGFYEFGAAIPLGLFTAAIVSRLRFLGVRAAGVHIALFGGLMAALDLALSSLLLWVMAHPDVADSGAVRALYHAAFAIGGVGYSVPFGLLVAGVSLSAGTAGLLPKWLVGVGLVIAACGEISWFGLVDDQTLFLQPLTRYAGFLWMIAAGFMLPRQAPTELVSRDIFPVLETPSALAHSGGHLRETISYTNSTTSRATSTATMTSRE
jgi:hypothetical protein